MCKMNNSTTSNRSQMERDVISTKKNERVCPSKLSRRELEDLYFTLLENNLELKRTVNKQTDKIKILSTKVQRLSSGRVSATGSKEKDCCASKAHINELKEIISELKRANDGLAERIRVLNMKLCSAKQFLSKTPSHHKCNLYYTPSSSNILVKDKVDSSNSPIISPVQHEDSVSKKSPKEENLSFSSPTTDEIPKETGTLCNENKCKITVEELRRKIANLQEELANCRAEYSSRLVRLEGEVLSVRQENVAARADSITQQERGEKLLERLRSVDAKSDELQAQLSIEKRKVLELETRLKLADRSVPLAKSIDKLTAISEPKPESQPVPSEIPIPQTPIQTKNSRVHYKKRENQGQVPIKKTKREVQAAGSQSHNTPPQAIGSIFRYSPPQMKDKKSTQKPKREIKATDSIKTQTPQSETKVPIQEPKADTQATPILGAATAIPFQEVSATEKLKANAETVHAEDFQGVPSLTFQEPSPNVQFQEAESSKLGSLEGRIQEPRVDTQSDIVHPLKAAFLPITYQEDVESPAAPVPLEDVLSIQSREVGQFTPYLDIGPSVQSVPLLKAIPIKEKIDSQIDQAADQVDSSIIPVQDELSVYQESITAPAVPLEEQTLETQAPHGVPVQTQTYKINQAANKFQVDERSIPFKEAKQQFESAPAVTIQDQKLDIQENQAAANQLANPNILSQEAKQQFEAAFTVPVQTVDVRVDQDLNQVAGPSIPFQEQVIDKQTKGTVPFQEEKLGSQAVKAIPFSDNKHSIASKRDSINLKTTYHDAYGVSIHELSPDSQTSETIPVAVKRTSHARSDFPFQQKNRDSISNKRDSYHGVRKTYADHDIQIHERADSQTSDAMPVALKRESKASPVEIKHSDYQFRESVSKEPSPIFYDSSKIIESKEHETTQEKSKTQSPSVNSPIIRLVDINPLINEERKFARKTSTSSYTPTQVIETKQEDEAKLHSSISPYYSPVQEQNQQLEVPSASPKGDEKLSNVDDSGYVDQEPQKDDEMLRINRDLLKKISELRSQLDELIIAAAGAYKKSSETPPETSRQNGPLTTPSDEDSLRQLHNKQTFDEIVAEIDSEERLRKLRTSSPSTRPELPVSNIKEMTASLLSVDYKSQVSRTTEDKQGFSDEGMTTLKSPHRLSKSVSILDVNEFHGSEIKKPHPQDAEAIKDKSPPVEDMKSLRFDNIASQDDEQIKLTMNSDEDQRRDSKSGKRDEEYRYQIPGPIPPLFPRSPRERKSKDRKPQEEKTVKIVGDDETYIPKDARKESVRSEENDKITTFINNIKTRRRSKGGINIDDQFNRNRYKEESNQTTRDSYYCKKTGEDKKTSDDSLDVRHIAESVELITNGSTQVDEDKDRIALCWQSARVCACGRVARAVPALRTCSGALHVLPPHHSAAHHINYCACTHHKSPVEQHRMSEMSEFQPQISVPVNLHHAQTQVEQASCSHAPNKTYTHSKCSRSTSPDNTEKEISSLPDLPEEKEVKYHRYSSSGEKGTMTTTETETNTDFGSLSEGEIPLTKRLQKSYGEKAVATVIPESESTQRMEAALQAISDELTRCHKLLEKQTQKRLEEGTKRSMRESDEVVPLRSTEGVQRLTGTHHVCVFTLHIGTLVLSDEAVLKFRDKSLVLMWRYYDQSVTLTRMRAGRVVLFDFSTEYDVNYSEDFLTYMKYGKMPLVICEMNKQDEPIASCSLPLRDALLHLNRRADMSLALMAGGARAGSEKEFGVLDLWCLLRANSTVTRHVAHAIARSSIPGSGRRSLLEEDFSNERISQDLDLHMKADSIPMSKMRQPHVTYPAQEPGTHSHQFGYDDEARGRRRSSSTRKSNSTVSSNLGRKDNQDNRWPGNRIKGAREGSELITNAVGAHKTSDEMKAAVERKAQHDDTKKIVKNDDIVYQGRSSIGSMRSHSKKTQSQLARVNDLYKYYPPEPIDSLQDLLKENEPTKDRKHSYTPKCELVPTEYDNISRQHMDEASDISRKYKHITRLLGVNKMIESKKQVKYSDSDVQPEKEVNNTGREDQSIEITVLWLALNEECDAMVNPNIKRLYVAYKFLGRNGAELETPISLPKPKHYVDKCYFNFKKTFNLHDCDMIALGHMARLRSGSRVSPDPRDCLIFTVVSEPPEDPLGLSSCEDIGYAYLYLGDILAYSGGSTVYTEVVAVHAARGAAVCGVLAVRIDGLEVLRRALNASNSTRDLSRL